MSYRLEIELPGLPKNPNGSHGHWRTAHGIRKTWRNAACLVAKTKAPPLPLSKCRLECTRFSTSSSDYDNLVASFKPLIDGLKDAGIIKDDNQNCIIERKYTCEKAKPKQGKVRIIVEEILT
jgi:Holliday junction resolvase RusA-like endonuclease